MLAPAVQHGARDDGPEEEEREMRPDKWSTQIRRERRDACESACTGVSFTDADPTGAVKALAEELRLVLSTLEYVGGYPTICKGISAALARVRLTMEKGE